MLPTTIRDVAAIRPPIPLDANYAPQGRGGVDLSKHKLGQEGLKKCVDNFVNEFPHYHGRNLDLSEKVVLVGDPCVGKTCLLLRFIEDTFKTSYQSTIGVDFYHRKYKYGKLEFLLNIWDTAGQERFRSLSKSYYRGAEACIVVFDLGIPDTFARAKQWASEVKNENKHNTELCVFLVGCKSDVFQIVSATQAERAAHDLGAEYFEVSGKTGYNVKNLFDRVATILFERALLRCASEFRLEAKATETNKAKEEKAILIGGGKGLGDPSGGKGTQNWKDVKKRSNNITKTTMPYSTTTTEKTLPPFSPSHCCKYG